MSQMQVGVPNQLMSPNFDMFQIAWWVVGKLWDNVPKYAFFYKAIPEQLSQPNPTSTTSQPQHNKKLGETR